MIPRSALMIRAWIKKSGSLEKLIVKTKIVSSYKKKSNFYYKLIKAIS